MSPFHSWRVSRLERLFFELSSIVFEKSDFSSLKALVLPSSSKTMFESRQGLVLLLRESELIVDLANFDHFVETNSLSLRGFLAVCENRRFQFRDFLDPDDGFLGPF